MAGDNGLAYSPAMATAEMLRLAQQGDEAARNRLMAVLIPRLTAWARGRLPKYARGRLDTDDLVQVTLIRALGHLDGFEPRYEGALMAYLRTTLMNRIRDELRRVNRAPGDDDLAKLVGPSPANPLEEAIGHDAAERYERGLMQLSDRQREAVLLRVEFGYTYEQIAEAMESPSTAAARMNVVRGLEHLAEIMNESNG